MVEEWKIGDEFEVISNNWGYLEKGNRGKCYGITPLANSGNIPSIFFTPKQDKAIHINRIKKIPIETTYELW